MRSRAILAAALAGTLASSVAHAETRVLARSGPWQAFGGTANDGRPLCGVSTKGTGKYFGLKYFSGSESFTIQLGSSAWRIKDGGRQRIVLQFDQSSPWNGTGTGMHFADGDAGLEFNVRRMQLPQFMREFRASSALAIRFPESSASGWRADLTGTDTISETFARCIAALR